MKGKHEKKINFNLHIKKNSSQPKLIQLIHDPRYNIEITP
jgi:hypothetical protein